MTECPTCGDTFDTEHGMKVHHAHQHDESIAFKELECWNCGAVHQQRDSEMTDGERNFCSQECYIEWVEEEQNPEQHPCWDGGKHTVHCEWCGCEVQVRKHRLENHENTFCSMDCKGKWASENRSGEDHPLYNSVSVECENCGDKTEKVPAKVENYDTHFCSRECKYEYSVGEKHPTWVEDSQEYVYYGSSWRPQRQKVLERDDYECQDCGMSRNEHQQKYERDLEVHHKIPFLEFEDTQEANQLSNLITLCTSCHAERENRIEV